MRVQISHKVSIVLLFCVQGSVEVVYGFLVFLHMQTAAKVTKITAPTTPLIIITLWTPIEEVQFSSDNRKKENL